MPSRQLLETLDPAHWDSQEPAPNSGFNRMRWLQGLSDLVNRPVNNRLTAQTSATAIAANGTIQSSGVGTALMQPKRYAEFTVKARVTFRLNSVGPAYLYVVRTVFPHTIPANGAALNAGDVIVGGDAFSGGMVPSGGNQAAAFSFLDSGLSVNSKYSYYLAIQAPNGNVLNLVNNSQLLVMERS